MADGETRIGARYRLIRQVAVGGMGAVWEGWDEKLRRPVAVKRLQLLGLSKADADLAAQRIMREARLTARLHHPNAVQVFDVIDDEGRPCLVMQYVPSRSLDDLVRAEGPLSPASVARIGTQVAAALATAHRAGIVHRDVKPGNVLIAEDGTAKITDFGISHAIDDVSLTSTGLVTGTPAYLAPEVARGIRSDFASDVYSLGATLYMAVEGEPPTGTETNPMAVLHRVASGHTNPPVRSGPLTAMLLSMLATDPSQRPRMVDIATRLTDVTALAATDRTAALARSDEPAQAAAPLPDELSPRTRAVEPAASAASAASAPPVAPAAGDDGYDRDDSDESEDDGNYDGNDGDDGDDFAEQHRRRWPLILLTAAVLAALLTWLGVNLFSDNRTVGHAAAGARTSAHPPTVQSSPHPTLSAPSTYPGKSPGHRITTASSAPPGTRTGTVPHTNGSQAATASQLADALTHYFAVVPSDLGEGWSLLTPSFQQGRAGGRDNYDRYWNTINRVAVNNASGSSPHNASATLTYYFKNGRQVTEHTTFRFVRQNGVLKIDGES